MQLSTALVVLPDHPKWAEDFLDENRGLVDRIRVINEVLYTRR